MSKQKLAELVSRALGMHTWFPILLTVGLLRTGLTDNQIKLLFPSLFFFNVFVPIAYIVVAQKRGKVSGWDLPKKEERHGFLIVALFSSLISIGLMYFFGDNLLFNLNLVLIGLVIIVLAITRFWKISFHTGLNTAGSIIVNFLFNWQLPILYLTIPLALWARYTLKSHNMRQLIAGIVIPAAFILGAFKYLGYI